MIEAEGTIKANEKDGNYFFETCATIIFYYYCYFKFESVFERVVR